MKRYIELKELTNRMNELGSYPSFEKQIQMMGILEFLSDCKTYEYTTDEVVRKDAVIKVLDELIDMTPSLKYKSAFVTVREELRRLPTMTGVMKDVDKF